MQIISFLFIFFMLLVFVAMYISDKILKKDEEKVMAVKWILLAASYIFTIYADIRFAMVLLLLTLITWFCARNIKYYRLAIGVALLALGYFKYTNFFVESFAKILGETDYLVLNILLPLGISYYTFSAISYVVDVHKNKLGARGLKDVALYLAFFPKITSGPIQRSKEFFEQVDVPKKVGWTSFSCGIQIFVFGLFKKIVIADRLSVFVNQVYETPLAFHSFTVFLAVIAYSLQIYFDFSGYSDMAIGVARVLDIHLPRNFNLPYMSHNVTELWKRWHISLSSWLQEYLYISLGGNRKGKVRTYVNLVLTMVLGGIWHGPKWTYIIWGLLHGIALAVHKIWTKMTGSNKKEHGLISNIISITGTFLFTSFCWIFFRADTVSDACIIIKRIVSFENGIQHPYIWLFFAVAVLFVSTIAAYMKSKDDSLSVNKKNQSIVDGYYPILDLNKFWHLVVFFVFCGLILGLAYTGGSPFIYGRY
ncbi:MAG: MBOAT family protein [Agathobacter sp.]|nr:MBOAT family protein [Agathobacter sp.]